MNDDQVEMVDSLRDDGYMVIIFTPDELRNISQVDKRYLENMIVVLGREYIDQQERRNE
jgi:hypothetical protein